MDCPPEIGSHIIRGDSLSPVAPYRLVNIGNATPVRLLDYIETIENAIGKKAAKNMIGMQPGDVKQTFADVRLLKALTGYTPNTDYKTGIANFVAWFRDYYKPD
jgi:UDP-glucuronate 4-epimerase